MPLVLMLALAMLQLGLLMKDQLLVAGAARAGAREAAVRTDDAAAGDAAAGSGGLASERLTVEVSRSGGAGQPVTVTVRYREPVVVPLVAWLFPAEIVLESEATMRQEVDDATG
jgi:hypothetical protein